MVPTWAVVPSNGRPMLYECLDSLFPQVEGIVIVANGEDRIDSSHPKVSIVQDTGTDMNISRWWNIGMNVVDSLKGSGTNSWNTLVVNDDVVAPVNLVETLSKEMRNCSAVLSFPNQHDNHRAFWREPGPVNLFHRITGYCFMLRGEALIRMDESLKWWYGDDDLDWRARTRGGSLLVPLCPVEHRAPNGSMLVHPELHTQAAIDRETFIKKWGQAPW